jgi:hypothetical protein
MADQSKTVYLIILWTEGDSLFGSRYIMDAFVFSERQVAELVYKLLSEKYSTRVEMMRASYNTLPTHALL